MNAPGTLAALRDAVCAALTLAADGGGQVRLTGWASAPRTPSAGDAWPVWERTTVIASGLVEHTWNVLVLLPGGTEDDQIHAADTLGAPLTLALMPLGRIESITPVLVDTATGTAHPALSLRLVT